MLGDRQLGHDARAGNSEDVLARGDPAGSTLHAEEHLTPCTGRRGGSRFSANLSVACQPVTIWNAPSWMAPYILISNHNSLMDPLLVAGSAIGTRSAFREKRLVKTLFTLVVPKAADDRCGPSQYGYGGVARCLKTLREGHPLGVFPEGTRLGRRDGTHGKRNCRSCPAQLTYGKLLPVHRRQAGGCSERMSVMGSRLASRILPRGINREACQEVHGAHSGSLSGTRTGKCGREDVNKLKFFMDIAQLT